MRASSSEVATVKIRTGHLLAVHAAVGSALEQAWSCDLGLLTVVAVDDRTNRVEWLVLVTSLQAS